MPALHLKCYAHILSLAWLYPASFVTKAEYKPYLKSYINNNTDILAFVC